MVCTLHCSRSRQSGPPVEYVYSNRVFAQHDQLVVIKQPERTLSKRASIEALDVTAHTALLMFE